MARPRQPPGRRGQWPFQLALVALPSLLASAAASASDADAVARCLTVSGHKRASFPYILHIPTHHAHPSSGPLPHSPQTLSAHGVTLPADRAAVLCRALDPSSGAAGGKNNWNWRIVPSHSGSHAPTPRSRIVIDGSGTSAFEDGTGESGGGFATFSGPTRGRDYFNLLLTGLCVLGAALASGLTIGLMVRACVGLMVHVDGEREESD